MDDVNTAYEKQSGFIATTAVMILAIGMLAFILTTTSAVVLFADSIERREARIQNGLNEVVCEEVKSLLVAKNYLLEGGIEFREFGCIAHQ